MVEEQSAMRHQHQEGMRDNLNFFHGGGVIELKIGEPHQVGPPVSITSDDKISSSH